METESQDLPLVSQLFELAWVFLRLGTLAFGGPAAHLQMMQREFVEKRHWLTDSDFADMIGASNLIPGPSSTEVAIHIGYRRRGFAGLVLAGICFILPAALIVSGIAWLYVHYGQLPRFQSALLGVKPVVVAIVGQAILTLFLKIINSWPKRVTLGFCLPLAWLGVSEFGLLMGSGLALGFWELRQSQKPMGLAPLATVLIGVAAVAAVPWGISHVELHASATSPLAIFLTFLQLGSVLYGSGYVLLAFLERDVVAHLHWISKGQLIDAVAIGQFTPGPVFTTATFIGFLVGGPTGAFLATVGIFLPAFVFVGFTGRMLPMLRQSPISGSFLDGVNAAAVALMAVVLVRISLDSIRDVTTSAILLVSLLCLIKLRVNSAFLILAGGLIGFLFLGHL
jgi:chromate transporter